jgi:peroxiredoxin
MSDRDSRRPPVFAGRIGVTLLCVYLFVVTLRIGGCYGPELAPRDELREAGVAVGEEFPAFTLRAASGEEVSRDQLRGTTTVLLVVPSLDWSAPTKARVLDLADAVEGRDDVRVAVILPAGQATARSLAFVRDRRLPFPVLVDSAGLIDRLGLGAPAPDGTPAAVTATFVLDANARVRFRDVRKNARSWPDVAVMLTTEQTPTPAAP